MVTEQEVDPKDPLGIKAARKSQQQQPVQPTPVQPAATDDPLGIRAARKKKEVTGSSGSSPISLGANYRQSVDDFNTRSNELQDLQSNLEKIRGDLEKREIMKQDPAQLKIFHENLKLYNSQAADANRKAKELKNLQVLLENGRADYMQDNSIRQDKLFKSMGMSDREVQQLKNKIYKELHPENAKEVDEGRLIPHIDDVDADDIAKSLTGKTTVELDALQKAEENRSISDRVFGAFGRSVEKTLAFEFPASVAGTIQNLLGDVKIKPEDLEKSQFSPGITHQIKKVIDLVPGATEAINQNVDDARVGAFQWAQKHRTSKEFKVAGITLKNDENLIRSLSQVKRPLDVIDFVFANAGQGAAQIIPGLLTRGATSTIQELGNNQIDGTIAIAEKMGIDPEEVIRRDLDEPVIARNFAIIQGALDQLGATSVLQKLGPATIKKELKEKALTWFQEARKAGRTEFLTEGAQSALGQTAIGKMTGLGTIPAVKNIDWFQVLDEAAAGAVGGSTVSAGGSGVEAATNRIINFKKVVEKPAKTPEEQQLADEFLDSVVEVAKKNGDPRSPEEIKEFVTQTIAEKVNVPEQAEPVEPDGTALPEVPAPGPEAAAAGPVETAVPAAPPEVAAPIAEQVEPGAPVPGAESVAVPEQPGVPVPPATPEIPAEVPEVPTPAAKAKPKAPRKKVEPKAIDKFTQTNGLPKEAATDKERVIASMLTRFPKESWNRFGDENYLKGTPAMRMFYLNKKGLTIDQQAQAMSLQFNPYGDGTDITPQDIVEFVQRFPKGKRQFKSVVVEDAYAFADNIDDEFEGGIDADKDLREALLDIEAHGITPENFQSPAIQEKLANRLFFEADDHDNIKAIFEYGKTEEGSQKINSLLAAINEQVSEEFRERPGLPEVQGREETATQEVEIGEGGYPAAWGTNKEVTAEPKAAPKPEPKAKPPKPPAPKPEPSLKGATKQVPKEIKKSEKVQAELDDLFKKLNKTLGGTLSAGINPEAAVIGAQIVGKYVEFGVVKFKEIAQDVYARYGEDAFDNFFTALKAGYGSILATSDDPNLTPLDELKKFKAEDFKPIEDDTATTGDLEPDSQRDKADESVGVENVPPDTKGGRGSVGKGGKGVGKPESAKQGDSSFSDRLPPPSGQGPNPAVDLDYRSDPVTERVGRGTDDSGSGPVGDDGIPLAAGTTDSTNDADKVKTGKRLSFAEKLAAQKEANKKVKIIPKDLANIVESMPMLLPHQAENVFKAENRFLNPPKPNEVNKGMLFTDATGTGKTFTGLGIIKRMQRMGTKDVLLIVPTDQKVKDWQDDGKHFDIDLYQLKDTKDGGKPGTMVVTTYANFRQNPALQERAAKNPFGLVMYDESHNLVSNKQGESTSADQTHKALTNAPNQAWSRAKEKYQTMWDDAYNHETGTYEKRKKVNELIDTEAARLVEATKVVFLSATPFSYHKNLLYADGYLYKIMQGEKEKPGDAFKQFFVQNFGYRIRYHKLTEPEADVDVGIMERSFHTKLTKQGAISSTRLQLDKDYSREFILIDDKVGSLIDEGYKVASDGKAWTWLPDIIRKKFNYLYTNQMLESMKAKQSLARIQQHLDLGRKIVLFHTFNNSLPTHPFDLSDPKLYPATEDYKEVQAEIERFHSKYPQYRSMNLSGLTNPIETIQKRFGDKVVTFNGNVSKKDRRAAVEEFNKSDSGKDIIVVQMEAGGAGISLHDVTGEKQRVMMNFGLPVRPTIAIQTEGRTYRIGQMSDAVIEYPVIHLNFEKYAFASKINERISTAENLAFGEQARNLKEAFKDGYKTPVTDAPHTGQGTGGRETDAAFEEQDQFMVAKTLYYSRQKRTAKTKAREGTDYFATPEPIGLKMVEWLQAQPNMSCLEPSAGHGAIARWFSDKTKNKFIEPSYELRADMAINVEGELIGSTFEDYHIINKFDRIAMNPPYGHAGKDAWGHTEKALGHLRDGGRVITIVPDGPAMQKYIDKWLESEDSKDFFITAEIKLPGVAFNRAGTNVRTKILIIDKQTDPDVQKKLPQARHFDFSGIENINELFDSVRDINMSQPLSPVSDLKVVKEELAKKTQAEAPKIAGDLAQVVAGVHTKLGHKIWTVRMLKRITPEEYSQANIRAKNLGGRYSSFKGNNAIPGFIFQSDRGAENANKLLNFINNNFADQPIDPSDEQGKKDNYGLMSAAKSSTVLADFEKRGVNDENGDPFKLYNEVIELSQKYNPNSTLGQGNQARGQIGTFYNPSQNIRLPGLNALAVAMHELVHAVDSNNNVIQDFIDNTKPNDPVRKRLTELYLKYYPKAQKSHDLNTRMVEGYATLVQKYLETPTEIENDFKDLVDAFLTPGGQYWKDDIGNFLQDVTIVIAKYQALDPLAKMGARITNDVIDQPKKFFMTPADRITSELFDRIHPIEKLAKITGTHFTQDDLSLWLRMSNNAFAMAQKNVSSRKQRFYQMDKKGEWKVKHNFNYYTLVKSLDDRKLQEEFAAYLYARRIKYEFDELNALNEELNNILSGQHLASIKAAMQVDDTAALAIQAAQAADVQAEIDKLGSILGNEGVSEQEANEAWDAGKVMFKEDEKIYDILTREDLEFAHNPMIQLLDDEGYDKFMNKKGYATFKRATYDELIGDNKPEVPAINVSKAGKTGVSQFLVRRGSSKPVLNPLMGAMLNHNAIMSKGMQQMVYNKFLPIADMHPTLFQVEELKVSPESTKRYPQEGSKEYIVARKNFKRVPIRTDADIKRVLDENYSYHNAHLLERVGVTMSQLFRTGTTGIFWQFFLNNIFIDQVTAFLNSRNGMMPFISSAIHVAPAALNALSRGALFTNSPEAAYLKEYLFLAGTSQTFLSADIEGIQDLNDIIKGKGKGLRRRTNRMFENIVKWMSTPGNATEIMTRGTEYILARKAGKTQVVALEEAGRVSASFHHIGRFGDLGVGKSAVRSIPYFNASLQVLKTTANSLATPKGAARYAFAALSMVAMSTGSILYMLGADDDEEEDERIQILKSLPPDALTKYLFLPSPYSKSKLIQIRIPETVGWLAGLCNMMLLEGKGHTKYDWNEYGEASASFLPTQLNPFNPVQAIFSYIPQVFKPTIETGFGMKLYPNVRPIESKRDESLPPELRFNKYTTPGAIFLGSVMGWSPKKIDHFISGTGGRATGYFLGKPGAWGIGRILERELYLEASRQVQYFYEIKKEVAQDMKAHTEGLKEYSDEEVALMYQRDSLVADIEGLLNEYKDASESEQEVQNGQIRNAIFEKCKELEDLK